MNLDSSIQNYNNEGLGTHQRRLEFIKNDVQIPSDLIQKLKDFQIAIPSWALGTGGTRFGRFSGGGEPGTLEEKIADVGLLINLRELFPYIFLGIFLRMQMQLKSLQLIMVWLLMPLIQTPFKIKQIKL
jgi:L-rhamnose isomerase/sugar isomerase